MFGWFKKSVPTLEECCDPVEGGFTFYYRFEDGELLKTVRIKIAVMGGIEPNLKTADHVARKQLFQQIGNYNFVNITKANYEEILAMAEPSRKTEFTSSVQEYDGAWFMNSIMVGRTRCNSTVSPTMLSMRYYLTFMMQGKPFRSYLDLFSEPEFIEGVNERIIGYYLKQSMGWDVVSLKVISKEEFLALTNTKGEPLNGIDSVIGHGVGNYDMNLYAECLEAQSNLYKRCYKVRTATGDLINMVLDFAFDDPIPEYLKNDFCDATARAIAPEEGTQQYQRMTVEEFTGKAPVGAVTEEQPSAQDPYYLQGPAIGRYMDKPIPSWLKRNGKTYTFSGIFQRGYKLKSNEIVHDQLVYSF